MIHIVILAPAREAGRRLEPFAKAFAQSVRVVCDISACAQAAKAENRPLILAPAAQIGALRRDLACADLPIVAYALPMADDDAEVDAAWSQMATSLADDVLVAPFGLAEFLARCARAQARRAPRGTGERRLRDRLTGVLTRTGLAADTPRFEDMLSQGPATIVRAALPGLSRVNAVYGAFIGDGVLKVASQRLRDLALPGAVVARVSGDEFLLIEFGAASREAGRLEALRAAMSAPFDIAGDEYDLETRIARTLPMDGDDTLAKLIERALSPQAQDGAKAARAQPAAQSPRNAPHGADIAAMSARVDLHYQPQVSLLTGETVGGEALLRWRGDGASGAAGALGWARDDARRVALAEWVLRRAGADLDAWSAYAGPASRISINVGVKEVLDRTLFFACRALADGGALDPRRIDIDIPGGALAHADAQARLGDLVTLGLTVTLDASDPATPAGPDLANVARIKLDRDALAQPRGVAFLDQARARNLRVIVARVESAAHLALARQGGCAQAQGYLFAAPAPLADLARRVA